MNNKYAWFNIGQKGTHWVTWECATINLDFDPSSIRFETEVYDENDNPVEKWVRKENLNHKLHRSVEKSFEDLDKVAEWVKDSYETGEDIYVGDNNWLHIYEVFDMDNLNEYGLGKPLWDL